MNPNQLVLWALVHEGTYKRLPGIRGMLPDAALNHEVSPVLSSIVYVLV